MVTSALVDALRRARASWRGQLLVVALGAVLLGLTLLGGGDAGDLRLRSIVGSIELLVLLALSIRMALTEEAGYDGTLGTLGYEVLTTLPRLLVQVGVFALVPALAWTVALQLVSLMTGLGLVTVPVAFLVSTLAMGPTLLAACAVQSGDRSWLPRSTWRAVHGRLLRVTAVVLVGGVVAACCTLPVALFGFVVTAVAGPLGFLGAGLVASAAIPWFGCGALATWRALDARADIGDVEGPSATVEVPAVGSTEDVAAAFGLSAPAVPDAAAWMDGPAWDVAVEPGAAWGTWIRIEAPSVLGVRVSWQGSGAAPELALATEAGSWTQLGAVGASGDVQQVALQAGSTYIQVTSRAAASQAVSVGLLVPAATAA